MKAHHSYLASIKSWQVGQFVTVEVMTVEESYGHPGEEVAEILEFNRDEARMTLRVFGRKELQVSGKCLPHELVWQNVEVELRGWLEIMKVKGDPCYVEYVDDEGEELGPLGENLPEHLRYNGAGRRVSLLWFGFRIGCLFYFK
jgi:hypothetical protein